MAQDQSLAVDLDLGDVVHGCPRPSRNTRLVVIAPNQVLGAGELAEDLQEMLGRPLAEIAEKPDPILRRHAPVPGGDERRVMLFDRTKGAAAHLDDACVTEVSVGGKKCRHKASFARDVPLRR